MQRQISRLTLGRLMAVLLLFALADALLPLEAAQKKSNVKWVKTRREAMALSKKTGKPILMDVNAVWCGPCKMMKDEVFDKPAFAQEAKRWVLWSLDGDRHATLANFYGADGFPTLIVLKPNGKVVARESGYGGPAATMRFIRRSYAKAKK